MLLLLGMLLFKASLDVSYWVELSKDTVTYSKDFSLAKYMIGLLWCFILFFGIRHTERKASSFLLYLMFLFQIVPITTIYSLGNDSSEYYNILCLSFLLCELIVGYVGERDLLIRNLFISRVMCLSFACLACLLLAVVVVKNGLPSLIALDIYKVYELRRSGSFQLGKYMNYILTWTTKVFLPTAIAVCLVKKRYGLAGLCCGGMFLLYLYTGHKIFMFSIPFVLVCTIWAKRKDFYREIYLLGCAGTATVCALYIRFPDSRSIPQTIYSLFVRRSMFLPANNKFKHFDYFCNNPKMGIYGIFPRWIVDIKSHYEDIAYTFDISRIYYGQPNMSSDTGFFAEGFMRFGYLGIFLVLIIFALILRQVDRFQERTSYVLAVGVFAYQVFALGDAQLLGSFVFGPWMILLFFLLFYKTPEDAKATAISLNDGTVL